MTDPQFDPPMVRTWLDVLYAGTPGLVHVCATGNWTGLATTDRDRAAAWVGEQHAAGREGIYLRVTTLTGELPPGTRGGENDTHALPGLWADIDIAGPGHKTDQPLPPDPDAAMRIIAGSGLPEPSMWVHSGGGLYPWWLLDQAYLVTSDTIDYTRALSTRWQAAIARSAEQLGLHYGTGVGDLARVLRIPGTVNRKAGLTRPCTVLAATALRYTIDDLHAALAAAIATHGEPEPAPPAPRLAAVRADGDLTPGDDFEQRTGWDDPLLLGGAGWRVAYTKGTTTYWRRPGKDTAGISATTGHSGDRDRLFVFTDATGFEPWHPYTRFGAYALLHHAGDHSAAARELRRAGYGTPTPIAPDPYRAQQAAIADLIPGNMPATAGPRVLAAVGGTAARHLADPAPAPDAYGPTEDGLARALVATHGHELRYCPQRGKWLGWTGHRWEWDDGEHHRELIRGLARDLPDIPGWAVFKKRALSAVGVSGVERLARSDPGITVNINALDARPYELNTPAGIIDLRTGQLRPPDPAALHTRCTAVAPDYDHPGEAFEAFLVDTFADPGMAAYIQRLMGVSAIGTVLEQLLPFAHGVGANGKSTLLEAVMHVLGFGENGYAMAAPAEMLMVRRHSEHPAEIAQLVGARLVVCSELEDGQRFAEARIKQLTGRDSINARFMRRDPFTFTPSHTMWLIGNHKPQAQAGGPAFWRRVRLLPFARVVAEDKRDPHLGEKLAGEAGAILAWIARGAADYHQGGLREPAAVRVATAAYERDQDTVAQFVEECCHVTAGQTLVRVGTAETRAAYEAWCHETGEEPVTSKRLGMELRDRWAVEVDRSHGKRFYTGLTLLNRAPDPDEPDDDRDTGRYR